ncbi:hypothetical protein CryarDRAFT_0537 [Cryptosporangium arvum DSM 44712]|jgi:hypothetical protein|uniref:Uncharacterized protein n=2 Tax=Cryptosporangium TaxID=65502 RepID=A0A011ABU1_9ACTN|nr:hypothetical protein CryarDRAFT_0537 [Cryptosporangium arvum DSM 44712]
MALSHPTLSTMSTPLVLTLFTALTVAVIAGIMGAAMWGRKHSNEEDLEPANEGTPEHSLFDEVHSA